MADISMCLDRHCPARAGCYRYLAPPDNMLQVYGRFQRIDGEACCDHWWEVHRDEARAAAVDAKLQHDEETR